MLITQIKPMDEILSLAGDNTVIISCEGCKEVYFPEIEASAAQNELLVNGTALAVIVTDYVCSCDNLSLQVKRYMDKINAADTLLVFACGVGVQTVAEKFIDKPVFAACDTYPLPGCQGVTPLEFDCDQCGECYLNDTCAICPITACAKSLLNGQCGGAKNGKCEVDEDMDCGWERIYRKLEKSEHLGSLRPVVRLRDYSL